MGYSGLWLVQLSPGNGGRHLTPRCFRRPLMCSQDQIHLKQHTESAPLLFSVSLSLNSLRRLFSLTHAPALTHAWLQYIKVHLLQAYVQDIILWILLFFCLKSSAADSSLPWLCSISLSLSLTSANQHLCNFQHFCIGCKRKSASRLYCCSSY